MIFSKLRRAMGMEQRSSPAAEALNRFSLDLYAVARPEVENFAFSPASIYWALSVCLRGAGGSTAKELREGLGAADLDAMKPPASTESASYALAVANALFTDRTVELLPAFVASVAESYDAACEALDFSGDVDAARRRINEYVAEATADRIPDLLAPGTVGPQTRLMVVNAVYFKAAWHSQFPPSSTEDRPFTLLSGERVDTPMMQTTAEMPVLFEEDARVLELPYRGDEMSMVIVLPGEAEGLVQLEASLGVERIAGWLSRLRRRELVIGLPRFSIDAAPVSVLEPLVELGIRALFDPSRCDLSKASASDLSVGRIIHKTFLRVTEEGTEAAAATAVLAPESAPPRRSFVADRPFLYLIRDRRDGSILFLGRVTDPRGEN